MPAEVRSDAPLSGLIHFMNAEPPTAFGWGLSFEQRSSFYIKWEVQNDQWTVVEEETFEGFGAGYNHWWHKKHAMYLETEKRQLDLL